MIIKDKFKYHLRWFWKAMALWFLIIGFIPLLFSHIFQAISPVSSYFIYDKTSPVTIISWNKEGSYLILESNSYVKRDVKFSWYDSIYCNDIKYNTQVWEDYELKWDNFKKTQWAFDSYVFQKKDVNKSCLICGHIIATTSKWYKKTANYCTDYFIIQESWKNT